MKYPFTWVCKIVVGNILRNTYQNTEWRDDNRENISNNKQRTDNIKQNIDNTYKVLP